MLQIENEYGNFGCDHTYTYWLRDALWAGVGNDTVLWTSKLLYFPLGRDISL